MACLMSVWFIFRRKKRLAGFYPEDKKTAYLGPGNILFI